MQDFKDKVALVTGGGSGIGKALALAFAAEGARVAVADIDEGRAQAVAAECATAGAWACAITLDVSSATNWERAVSQIENDLGAIDVFCSNAGIVGSNKPLLETPVSWFRWIFEVNLFGSLEGVHRLAPGMAARGAGHILLTGSLAGLYTMRNRADYSASKHAGVAIADALRQELSASGIGVSVICPAGVDTPLWDTSRQLITAELSSALGLADGDAYGFSHDGMMPPARVAELALAGIRRDDFLIFTHDDSATFLRQRSRQVQESLETAGFESL